MGLPLFVAPVKSDVKRPRVAKWLGSPPRTSIRRLPYVNVRERATVSRRSRLLDLQEHRRRPMARTLETALTTDTTSSGIPAAAEYIRNGVTTPEGLLRSNNTEQETRQQAAADATDRDEDNNTRQDSRTHWWMVHPQSRRDDHIIMLGMERFRSRRRSRSPQVEHHPVHSRSSRRSGNHPQPVPFGGGSETAPSLRQSPVNDVNGLGDRNRSISPEGWDTLLSTLTPDPQPPSANSSFVSNVASQNPNTSFTSTSGQTWRLGTAPEPPCESGCENSDTEDGEAPPRRRHRVSRGSHRSANPVRFEVPGLDYTLMGDDNLTRRQPARVRDPLGPREGRPLRSDAGSINVYMARPTLLGGQRDGWVGSLSVGAPEDGSGSELPRPDGEGSFLSTTSTTSGDEDLVSLQRIVRSLASREDIPDEWWTETGLSRTLTRDRL